MQKLIVFLHADDLSIPSWLVLDSEGKVIAQTYLGDANTLAALAGNKEVIAVVPAEDVLLTSVKLPDISRSRLIQALPFALEEQLIDEIETLHFALGETSNAEEYPVAIVSKNKIQQWMELFDNWKIKPDNLLPLSLLLPMEPEKWYVIINQLAVLRLDELQGFACDVNNLSEILTFSLTTAVTLPKLIVLHNFTAPPLASQLDVAIKVQEDLHKPEDLLAFLAPQFQNLPAINLLQGIYRTKKSKLPQLQLLGKSLMYLAGLWLVLLVSYPVISYVLLKPNLLQVETGINKIYKENFPHSASVIAPKIRMEEKLRSLSGEGVQNRFLSLLAYLGKAKTDTPNIQLKSLDFQNNQLTVELLAANSEVFSAFTTVLTGYKLNVKQQNATLVGSNVNATVVIE